MAAIARRADREEAAAAPTRFLAKRRVHDVGAATRSNWTRTSNRGTKRSDRLGPSEHRGGHRGSGGSSSRPSPRLPRTPAYATARQPPTRRGRGRCRSYGRADAPTAPCKTALTRFRTSAHRHYLFREQETGTERPARAVQISTLLRGQRQWYIVCTERPVPQRRSPVHESISRSPSPERASQRGSDRGHPAAARARASRDDHPS